MRRLPPSHPIWARLATLLALVVMFTSSATAMYIPPTIPPPAKVARTMPDVVGLPKLAALLRLAVAHIRPTSLSATPSSAAPDTVVSQSPPAGAAVANGDAVALTFAASQDQGPGPVVVKHARMPDVRGLSLPAAGARLARGGLKASSISRAPNAKANPGDVFDQDPPPGTVINDGDSISLRVATAQPVMPQLVGHSRDEAAAILAQAALGPAQISYVPSDQPAGQVVTQSPPAGAVLGYDPLIGMAVSSGPQQKRLPGLVGLAEQAARDRLDAMGLASPTVSRATSSYAAGLVSAQSPARGASVDADTGITLTVSLGAPPPPAQPSVQVDPTQPQTPPGPPTSPVTSVIPPPPPPPSPPLHMPELRNLTLAAAEQRLASLGLTAARIRDGSASGVPPGLVYFQTPLPGQPVSHVRIVLSVSAKPPAPIWVWPAAAAGALALLAAAALAVLAAMIRVRPSWGPGVEADAQVIEAHAGPDIAIQAWVDPGDSAVEGPLPIIPTPQSDARPADG